MVQKMMNMLMTWAYGQKLLILYNFKFQKFSALGIRVFKMSTIEKQFGCHKIC